MCAESVGVEDMGEEMSAEDMISVGDMGVVGFEIPGAAGAFFSTQVAQYLYLHFVQVKILERFIC